MCVESRISHSQSLHLTSNIMCTLSCLMHRSLRLGVQVLDLGVTRLLVQKLVEVFPKICQGDVPLAGTDAATRRVSNLRLHQVGRRSKACKMPPGYVVGQTWSALEAVPSLVVGTVPVHFQC